MVINFMLHTNNETYDNIGNNLIERLSCYKHFGVQLSNDLKWNNHAQLFI